MTVIKPNKYQGFLLPILVLILSDKNPTRGVANPSNI
jgi:hypothetical protein